MNRLVSAFFVAGLVVACNAATLNRLDPPIPVNSMTYDTCPGLTAPDGSQLRCLKPIDDQGSGGEQCPMSGHQCIELWPTAPNPDGMKVKDAGIEAPVLVPTTAPSPLVAPKEVLSVRHDGHG